MPMPRALRDIKIQKWDYPPLCRIKASYHGTSSPVPDRAHRQSLRIVVQLYLLYNRTVEVVIDTSAILAVITGQPEKADLVRLTRGANLVAPASVHWEVGNAISAMFKRKAISLREAIPLLEAYASIPIRLAELALKQAVELSARLNICAYDAYVLACAINHAAPLLTLDGGLGERARDLKLDVLEVNTR